MADNWVRPTSSSDPDSKWTNEANAYDNDLETYATAGTVGYYLELLLTSIQCDKIRIYAQGYAMGVPGNPSVNIDVYYSSAWHNIKSGTIIRNTWIEVEIGSEQTVSKARVKVNVIADLHLFEFNFNSLLSTVTCQDPDDIASTTATANGNITQKGKSAITVRGFKYGLTEDDTWSASDSGSFSTGAYTKGLTGLTANTTYHIRAYVTDTEDTYYSAWTTFQTAASGTVPTGTKVSICSDYTGYTYKQHESLTDDEETYTSYFILTTDLGKGLHLNKRIEEIYSYFMDKSSGTAKVYIKRDNETTWQYAGEISMEGDDDINIKHLPSDNVASTGEVDYLAKHYLIKYVFENDFEFIGLVTEAVPGDIL